MSKIERWRDIISGSVPETTSEELFLFFYEGASEGVDLGDLIKEVDSVYDDAGAIELEAIIIGYSTGQEKRKMDLDTNTKQIH